MHTTPSSSLPSVQETAGTSFFSLDVLRGLAVFGILVTSIWAFAGFAANERAFYLLAPSHGGNYKLLAIISLLFESKMTALLALAFGAGMVLFLQKKEHPVALNGTDVFMRQQIWFILLGLFLSLVILWPDELLYHFGITGILLFAFWKLPARSLFIGALVCTCIYAGKNYWNYADDKTAHQKYIAVTVIEKKFKKDSADRAIKNRADSAKDPLNAKTILAKNKITDSLAKKKDTLTSKQAEEKGKWEGLVKSLKYDSAKTVAQNKSMRAGYSKIWFYLKGRSQTKESTWLYSIGVWDLGSMMFLGMALLGIGFFSRRFSASTYFLVALGCIIAGLALGWFRFHTNQLRLPDYTKFIETHSLPYNQFLPLEQLLSATGYASLVMWLLQVKVFSWFWKSLADVGRMALSNYILQTIICAFIFYGYGLGFFGRFKQWELYFIVAEICLVQVVFSVLWLRFYRMGPIEWAIRSLMYRKKLPLKKQPDTSFIN